MNRNFSKLLAIIVLVLFSWTFAGVFQVAYAIDNLPQTSNNTHSSRTPKSEERFQKAIEEIGEILEDPSTGREAKAAKVKEKKAEIENLDTEIRKQFAETEKKLQNGTQENWIGKYCREKVENAGVIDFGLSEAERDNVLATALQLVDEQVLYPIHELLGTWWAIITKKEWHPNPVDDPHAMYCSAFVRDCYREAGADFLGRKVSISNTTPEHIGQAGIKAGKLKLFNT